MSFSLYYGNIEDGVNKITGYAPVIEEHPRTINPNELVGNETFPFRQNPYVIIKTDSGDIVGWMGFERFDPKPIYHWVDSVEVDSS
jgi:hypothetical protein